MTDAQKLSEIATHKKRLWSKEIVPKIFFCRFLGSSLFQSKVFLYFTEVVAIIHSSMERLYCLEEHSQPWIAHRQCIWQNFYDTSLVSSMHILKDRLPFDDIK